MLARLTISIVAGTLLTVTDPTNGEIPAGTVDEAAYCASVCDQTDGCRAVIVVPGDATFSSRCRRLSTVGDAVSADSVAAAVYYHGYKSNL